MSKTETMLRILPLVERLKRAKLQEEDRRREDEKVGALMEETGLTLGQLAALEKGLISGEDLGIGKQKFGAGDRRLVDRVRSAPRAGYDSTAFGGKQQPSRLGMDQAAGLDFKPAPQAKESPFGDIPSFADIKPQDYDKLARLMTVLGGVPEGDRSADFERLGGKYGPLPGEYQYISPDEKPKASRIGRKLQEGAKTGKTTLDEQDLHWLGQPFSKTPLGRKNRLKKAGYRQKPGTDEWEPAPKATGDWLDDLLGGEAGGETSTGGEDLDAQILETQKEIRELLKSLK